MKYNNQISKILLVILIPFCIYGFNSANNSKGLIVKHGNVAYMANTVVVKLKPQFYKGRSTASTLTTQFNTAFSAYNFSSAQQIFETTLTSDAVGLKRIMEIKYTASEDPAIVASKLKKLSNVEWAEPKFLRLPCFVPNDSSYNSSRQWNLFKIHAEEAWNISKGDTNIIIGIVDTGVDWPHPDIKANMWSKIGYDFGGLNGTPDNNPIEDNPYHGTFVAGMASAVTNNNRGIAAIGYKSKLMAVKTAREDMKASDGTPYIVYGFEGIKYAVDNGAKVINCSWGGSGYSNTEQDVINYAVENGALVVAAAGNDNSSENFYPASYKGVLSVAATDQNDNRTYFSNYGTDVDVTAPGIGLYSTWQPNTYLSNGAGTSFSSPQVAGLAALVFAHFPTYTPLQVAEQIRVNSDNIDSLNPAYKNMLGYGRINAYKALADTNSVSVRATNIVLSDDAPGDNNDGVFEPGETINVKVKYMNYLHPVNNLSVSLESKSSYATIQNGSFNVNSIATLDSTNNYASVYSFKIANNVPTDEQLIFKLNYSANGYSDFQLFKTTVNISYYTQSGNNLAVTLTSKGNFGYNDYSTNLQGDGFKFLGSNSFLFEGALMMGTSVSQISDAARGIDQSVEDASFNIVSPLKISIPGKDADQEGVAIFNDDGQGSSKLGITATQISYTYSDSIDNNYIIIAL